MTRLFNVSFEIVTPESAEHGDAESRGFIGEGLTLRDALATVIETESPHCSQECIEAGEYPVISPRSITVTNGADYYTGASESRSIHFPETLTPATRRRIARLMGARA